MPQPFSMVGAELPQDQRELLMQKTYANKNIPNTPKTNDMLNYMANGVPYDIEGLMTAYALKHGQEKAVALRNALPKMGLRDMLEAQFALQEAGQEADAMRDREQGRANAQSIITVPR